MDTANEIRPSPFAQVRWTGAPVAMVSPDLVLSQPVNAEARSLARGIGALARLGPVARLRRG